MTTATTGTEPDDPGPGARTTVRAVAHADLVAPVRWPLRVAMGIQVVSAVAAVVPFVALAELAEVLTAAGPPDTERVVGVIALLLAGLSVRGLGAGVAGAITHFADVRFQAVTRERIVAHLGRLPLGWFTARSSGDVLKAVQNDVHDMHHRVAHGAIEQVDAIVVPAAGLGYLFWLDWRLGLLAMATLPIYAVAHWWMTRGSTERMHAMNTMFGRLGAAMVEFVGGIAVVKIFGQARRAHDRFRRTAEEFADTFSAWVRPMLRVSSVSSMALSAPVVALVTLAGGTWFVLAGWVSPAEVLVTVLVAQILPTVVLTMGFSRQQRMEAEAAAGRIVELLAVPPLPEPRDPRTPVGAEVSFENVAFAYPGGGRVLEGIDLHVAEGTITALVGPSGAGKSTLASLVPRFGDVDEGVVRIGGVDVRDIAASELYRHVGFVLQDAGLVHGTVADNIRLGDPAAVDERVRTAARAARIDSRIEGLPRGYDSVVGQDAVLSGGEAQRVSIARALLADAPILVLDEATAFADPQAEAEIQDALSELARGRTVIVIAHRLGSVVHADEIAVIAEGVLVERGRHDELVAAGGRYARMWAAYETAERTTSVEVQS